MIDIKKGSITSKLGTIPLRRCKTFVINARSRQIISVPIENADIVTGYLPLVITGTAVFLRENIIRQVDGCAKVYGLNTTTRNVELTIPPLEIEECEVIKPGPCTARQAEPNKHARSENGEKLYILLKNIDFNEHTVKEKNSILNSISHYLYQFHLPGDKLSCTSTLKHKINTIDVHKKQYRHPPEHNDVVIE